MLSVRLPSGMICKGGKGAPLAERGEERKSVRVMRGDIIGSKERRMKGKVGKGEGVGMRYEP